mgnify:CR=1 FL=1
MSKYPSTLPPGGLDFATEIAGTSTSVRQVVKAAYGRTPGVPNTDFSIGASLAIDYADMASFDYDAYFKYCAAYGLFTIRVSFPWENFQPNLADVPDPIALSIVTAIDTAAVAYGISIILDPMHNYGKRVVNGVTQYVGDTVVTGNVFAQSWLKIAQACADFTSIVGYELMFAPTLYGANITEVTWTACAQNAITQIRTVDSDRAILVDGFAASVAYSWSASNPDLHTLQDPANKLVFCARVRLDRDGSGNYYNWATEVAAGDALGIGGTALDETVGVRRLTDFVSWCKFYGFNGLVHEIAVSDDRGLHAYSTYAASIFPQDVYGWDITLSKTLSYLAENNIPALMLGSGPQYWKGITDSLGVVWDRHPLCIDPISAVYDTTTSADVADYSGMMSTQLGVVEYYTRAKVMPDQYTVTIDPTVTVENGDRIQSCTVTVNGYISRPFVISLVREDGSNIPGLALQVTGTGTDSVQIPAGVNVMVRATILTATADTLTHTTAENQQVYKEPLIFTNDGGLINPAPVVLDPNMDLFTSLGITAEAIIWPRLLSSAYTGNAVTLLSSDGLTTKSFGFTGTALGSGIDTTAITAWEKSSYVVSMLDQSGNANNLTTVDGGTPTDYPAFVASTDRSLPGAQWGYTNTSGAIARNRMAIGLDVGSTNQFAVIFAVSVNAMDSSQAVLYWEGAPILSLVSAGGVTSANGNKIGTYPLIYGTTDLYTFSAVNGKFYLRKNGLTVTTGDMPTLSTGGTTSCQLGWTSTSTKSTQMTFTGLVALKDAAAASYYTIERALLADLRIAPVSFPSYMGTSPARLVDFTQVWNGNYTLLQYLSILGQWSDDMSGIVINGNISADALRVNTPANQIIHDVTLLITPDDKEPPVPNTDSDTITNKITALVDEISSSFSLVYQDYTAKIGVVATGLKNLNTTVTSLATTVSDNYDDLLKKIQEATGAIKYTVVPDTTPATNTIALTLSGNAMQRYTIQEDVTFQIVTAEDPGDGTVWPSSVATGNIVYAKATALFVLDGTHAVTFTGTLGVLAPVGQKVLSMSSGSVVLTSGIPNKAGTVIVDFVTWDAGTTWYVCPVESTYSTMALTTDDVSYNTGTLTQALASINQALAVATQPRTKLLQMFVSVPPEEDEFLGSFIADTGYTYQEDFAGSSGIVEVPPDSPYTFTVQKVSSGNTTTIGTILVSLTGAVTFTAVAGTLVQGDLVRVLGNDTVDPSISGVSLMIKFTQSTSSGS